MATASLKFRWIVGAVCALCAVVAVANAQTPPANPLPPSPQISPGRPLPPPGQTLPDYIAEHPNAPTPRPAVSVDQQVAEWLSIGNHGEVAMAKLAQSKTQNQPVRQFAERMIRDHTQFLDELRPFEIPVNAVPTVAAPSAARSTVAARPEGPINAGRADIAGTPSTPAAPGTAGTPVRAPDIGSVPTPGSVPNSATVPTPGGLPVPGTTPPAPPGPLPASVLPRPQPLEPPPLQGTARPAPQNLASIQMHRGLDFFHVERLIGAQARADSTKQWDTMKPADADIAYMGQQIAAHENYIDTSIVLRQYASPRLQNVIDRGIQMAQSHLAVAKEIMSELTGSHYSEGRAATNDPPK